MRRGLFLLQLPAAAHLPLLQQILLTPQKINLISIFDLPGVHGSAFGVGILYLLHHLTSLLTLGQAGYGWVKKSSISKDVLRTSYCMENEKICTGSESTSISLSGKSKVWWEAQHNCEPPTKTRHVLRGHLLERKAGSDVR